MKSGDDFLIFIKQLVKWKQEIKSLSPSRIASMLELEYKHVQAILFANDTKNAPTLKNVDEWKISLVQEVGMERDILIERVDLNKPQDIAKRFGVTTHRVNCEIANEQSKLRRVSEKLENAIANGVRL